MSDLPSVPVDYVAACIERDVELLKRVSLALQPLLKRPIDRIRDTSADNVTPPCWWIYPGEVSNVRAAAGVYQQTYTVNLRFIIGTAQSGYDGVLARALWLILPAVTNYFSARKSLCYAPGQDPPALLDVQGCELTLTTPYGTFTDNGDVGAEWQQTLPFDVYFDSEDGY